MRRVDSMMIIYPSLTVNCVISWSLNQSAVLTNLQDADIMNEVITLGKEFYLESQSWHYDLTVGLADEPTVKLRVTIERNAYDFQSSMIGYALDQNSLSWNRLVVKPIKGAHCESVSYVDEWADQSLFDIDARAIIEQLILIVT